MPTLVENTATGQRRLTTEESAEALQKGDHWRYFINWTPVPLNLTPAKRLRCPYCATPATGHRCESCGAPAPE